MYSADQEWTFKNERYTKKGTSDWEISLARGIRVVRLLQVELRSKSNTTTKEKNTHSDA